MTQFEAELKALDKRPDMLCGCRPDPGGSFYDAASDTYIGCYRHFTFEQFVNEVGISYRKPVYNPENHA